MEKIPDNICNPNWDYLLKIFHAIPKNYTNPKTAKTAYNELKELAKKKILTERQLEGIIARCNHQIAEIDNPTPLNQDRAKKLEQFQKMRVTKLPGDFPPSSNGIK